MYLLAETLFFYGMLPILPPSLFITNRHLKLCKYTIDFLDCTKEIANNKSKRQVVRA